MVHPLFGPEVRLMLQEDDTAGMKAFCETLHPATVAEALAGELDVEEVWRFLQHTGIRNQAAIFEYLPMEWQVKLVQGTGRPHMARLVEQMSHDDRVDLLRRLQPRVSEELLRLVDEADRRDIAALVKYPENTAGSLMTTDYAWLPANITVAEALDLLRHQAPDRETIYYVYVLDEQRKLLGVVSLRDLILARRHAVLRDIMEREVFAARVTDDPEQVARDMQRYDFLAVPVVDEEGRLVGIITHDDVMDVVVQEATEDVHRMGAVGPIAENYLQADFVTVWRKRAFWLSCLFGAELLTFTMLSHFEHAIEEIVVLALFVPLCISTGGNSGSQAATLITRAMALGEVTVLDWFRILRHELLMGLALGVTLGGIGFVRGAMTPEDVRGDEKLREEAFSVRMPKETRLPTDQGQVNLPRGAVELVPAPVRRELQVNLPEGTRLQERPDDDPNYVRYDFPPRCQIREEAVSRWGLGWVIAQAVAAICLWGTLVGSMLPVIFKRLGVDPGIASSPFVATFVDVTGIFIYFTIAKIYLL
jgi:magnesium transporter